MAVCFLVITVLSFFHPCWQAETVGMKRSDDSDPLQAIVTQQSQLIAQLQAQVTALETRIARQEKEVAFFARMSGGHGNNHNYTGTIVFDAVDLSQGGGYDKLTGIFTAPVSGVYEFNIKITHVPPGQLHVHIVKNNNALAEVEGSGDDTKYHDRSSATTVAHVTQGQRVWVEVMNGSSARISSGPFQSTFMGVLISAD